MDHLPEVLTALGSLVIAVATLVQVVKARAEVTENTNTTVAAASAAKIAATDAKTAAAHTADIIGTVNGHGTAMEALTETVAKGDQLVELNEYTHKSIHSLRNTITPMVAKVDQLWRDAGHADEPPASSAKAGG